jgi:hypothetical protein
MVGGLLIGHLFEAAEHYRLAVALGQPVDLLVEDRAQIVPRSRRRVPRAGQLGGPPFSFAASSAVGFDLKRDPARHAMEPTAERVVDPECPGLAGQEQEGGLKRILGVIGVSEDAAANGHDHRTMPLHECFKSQLIALTGILLQEGDDQSASPTCPPRRACACAAARARDAYQPCCRPRDLGISTYTKGRWRRVGTGILRKSGFSRGRGVLQEEL